MPQIQELKSMVDYQEGSVVSRTIVNKKTGTITLFAFDEGEALSEHTTPYEALLYIIDGRAQVNIENESLKLNAGEIIVLPVGKKHSVKAITKFKMLLSMIKS